MISLQRRPVAQLFLRTPYLIDYKPNTHSEKLANLANAVADRSLGEDGINDGHRY
jgi:hypothetical protein